MITEQQLLDSLAEAKEVNPSIYSLEFNVHERWGVCGSIHTKGVIFKFESKAEFNKLLEGFRARDIKKHTLEGI